MRLEIGAGGYSTKQIVKETGLLLENKEEYQKMAKAVNPYGDGKAAERIVEGFGIRSFEMNTFVKNASLEIIRIAKSRVAKDSAIVLAGNVLSAGLGFIGTVLITKALGPAQFGLFSMALAIMTIASQFSDFGIGTSLVRFVSLYLKEDKLKADLMFKVSLKIKLIIATAVFLKEFVKNPTDYLTKSNFAFGSGYLTILEAMINKKLVFAVYENELKKDYLTFVAKFKRYNSRCFSSRRIGRKDSLLL